MLEKIKNKLGLNLRLSLILPYVIFSGLFIILPLILVIIKAFTPLNNSFNNWEIASSKTTWIIMWRSIWTGFVGGFLCVLIGFPYAYIIATSKSNVTKNIGLSLILSPLLIFTISKALSIRGLFSVIFDENSLNNEAFLILGIIYLYIPFVIMPLYQVLKNMPSNIIEASQDLGYGKIKTMLKVVIPYTLKAILGGFSLVFLITATSIILSDRLLPNGSQNQLIGNLINNFANASNPFDLANASTLVLITLLVLMSIYGIIYLIPVLLNKYRYKGGNNE
ncbi:ABC transporter permease [Mycoplasma zalophi]|uniref:ABC transporter permease subunit n=1 Tax=Mycoplasma zalophi TaxID=191287 RepID=A0ABS6DNX1_9MOLU|nr:ABC transporter permease subunit [Mycoplasma zalophi]MBU4691210.1 ABC transporter permease subunit [Mycoplasma zalophi]MBU4692015.1 ABC transporter permease subunit [Mycoplasma zalophi]